MTTVLDSEGEPLRQATRAEPDVVTPNELEAEELVGPRVLRRRGPRARPSREMVELGAREAIMTLPDGCLALLGASDAPARGSAAPDRPARAGRAVGSGDAFLAGFVAARYGGRSPEDCLRFGVACGAESTQHFGAGVLDPREVERLLDEVEVERLDRAGVHAGSLTFPESPRNSADSLANGLRRAANVHSRPSPNLGLPPWK